MSVVYTVTLNPALDYEVLVDGFRAGGLNRTSREHMHFGGKGVNVSTVLHSLGVDTTALGFVAGFTGRALEDGLKAGGIPTDFVRLEEGLTRVNVKIRSGGGGETEINSQGPAIPPAALKALLQKLDCLGEGDVLVLAGSLPAGLPGNAYQTILNRVEGQGVLTVVDAAQELLKGVLPCHPFLIKPNSAELGELFGKGPLTEEREILSCARSLQAQGARNILVSLAGEGSLLLDVTGGVRRLGVPRGTVRHTVGAGDSMVAGFLAGWLETQDYAAAHLMGAAAGSATAFSDGLAGGEEIRSLLTAF